nr:hypothetical protein [uncultured Fluviicola sp.]
MDNNYITGLFSMLFVLLISRILSERAMKKLDQNQKVALLDLFSNRRIYNYVILIGIIGLFFACSKFELISSAFNIVIYVILLTLYIFINTLLSYRKLKDYDFPDFYIRTYLFTSSLRIVGLVVFFAFMVI